MNASFRKSIELNPNREMTPSEYLNAAKKAMQLESDYQLAKRLRITPGEITNLRQGKRSIPTIIATKIAIALGIDPMSIIADLEAQKAKNPEKAEFWRSFLSRAD